MTANERRMAILEVLCERRYDKRANLAFEFGVSKRTIENDILELSLSYPVYTQQGTNGGVYVMEGFELGRKYLSDKQKSLLEKVLVRLTAEERKVMQSILKEFSKPNSKGKR